MNTLARFFQKTKKDKKMAKSAQQHSIASEQGDFPYSNMRTIGEGGNGCVMRAEDTKHKPVAIKVSKEENDSFDVSAHFVFTELTV